eukprot:gene19594-25498_t
MPERLIVNDDPLSSNSSSSKDNGDNNNTRRKSNDINSPKIRTESLTIRVSDEARIVSALRDAAKRNTTGSVYSVKVDVSKTGALGIGVKDLADNILTVSMLKRTNGVAGAGETAGIRLGDVVFGINFEPTREGSKTLLHILKKENSKKRKYLHIQCWRCHQLCSDSIPGIHFPKAEDMFVQSYSLYRTRVFSDWERWNFIEILLTHMMDEIKSKTAIVSDVVESKKIDLYNTSNKFLMNVDLEGNILQAKGLRTALCVRIVHTKSQADIVVYVLRVEDIETGLQWVVHRRYRDFNALHDELSDMSQFIKDITFPKKKIVNIRQTAKLIESRIVALEQYIRRVLHILTLYATMDPQASRSLRHVQNFLGVDKYIDCVHPPPVDDQRFIELMAYKYLNDFSSPACQQCVRFVINVDLDEIVTANISQTGQSNSRNEEIHGYTPVLRHISHALSEVEQFVIQQHYQHMSHALQDRRPDLSSEDVRVFIRKCVRRQVEAAIYLPLRRTIFRIVYSFLATKAQKIQRAMSILQSADTAFFTVDPYVTQAESLSKAVKAFRDVIQAYLPADQGQLLMHAAAAVVELHTECLNNRNNTKISKTETLTNQTVINPNKNTNRTSETRNPSSTDTAKTRMSLDIQEKPEKEKSRMSLDISKLFSTMTKRSQSMSSVDIAAVNTDDSTVSNASSKPINEFIDKSGLSNSLTDLTDKAILADPVGGMFAAAETIPNDTLLQDTRPRRGISEGSFELSSVDNDDNKSFDTEKYHSSQVKLLTKELEALEQHTNALALDPQSSSHHDLAVLVGVSSDSDLQSLDENIKTSKEGNELGPGSNSESILKTLISTPTSKKESTNPLFNSKSDDEFPAKSNEPSISSLIPSSDIILENHGASQESATHSSGFFESSMVTQQSIVSADDFLPLFTYVLVQAALPQLLLVKELMTSLVDDEECFGECGYYLATLEASTQHIADLADLYEESMSVKPSISDEVSGLDISMDSDFNAFEVNFKSSQRAHELNSEFKDYLS